MTEAKSKDAPKTTGLPEGWTLVSEAEGFFTAERYVESLGSQKVTESGTDLASLNAACEAYDAYLAGVEQGRKAEAEAAL